MYGSLKRFNMTSGLPENVFEDVKKILDSVKDSPASQAYDIKEEDILVTENNLESSKCRGCFRSKEIEITIQKC